MAFDTGRPVSSNPNVLAQPVRSRAAGIRGRLAALAHSLAEYGRLRRDHRHLSELTDRQLWDIGIRRVGDTYISVEDTPTYF